MNCVPHMDLDSRTLARIAPLPEPVCAVVSGGCVVNMGDTSFFTEKRSHVPGP
jgi:hypothetical protein